jgi:lysophospholipase L1-like esterase
LIYSAEYVRRLDLVNRGFSGYTSAQAVKVLPEFYPSILSVGVRFMTVFFGANDAVLSPYEQHIPLNQYVANLNAIVDYAFTKGQKPRILVLTPPPVNEHQLQFWEVEKGFSSPSRTATNTKRYAGACQAAAASLPVQVVDVWGAFMEAAGWKEGEPLIGSRDVPENKFLADLLSDGLHLTGKGYRIIFDEVMRAIKENWPDQLPENLPTVFPRHYEAPK